MMSTEEIPTISASETGSQIVDTKEVDAQGKTDAEVRVIEQAVNQGAETNTAIADQLDQSVANQLSQYPRLEATVGTTVRPVVSAAQRKFEKDKTTTVVENEGSTITTRYYRNNNPKTIMTHTADNISVEEYRKDGRIKSVDSNLKPHK